MKILTTNKNVASMVIVSFVRLFKIIPENNTRNRTNRIINEPFFIILSYSFFECAKLFVVYEKKLTDKIVIIKYKIFKFKSH
jgi:hypothetical protein